MFHVKQSLADAEAAKQRIEHVLGRGASGQAVEGQAGRAQPLGQHERVAERNGARQGIRRHLDEFPLAPAQGHLPGLGHRGARVPGQGALEVIDALAGPGRDAIPRCALAGPLGEVAARLDLPRACRPFTFRAQPQDAVGSLDFRLRPGDADALDAIIRLDRKSVV